MTSSPSTPGGRVTRPARTGRLLACAAALCLSAAAHADDRYPARPITLVVPFAPGGNIDTTARIISAELGRQLGQSVVVENRAGAGGVIGATYVARAKPDGYTLLLGNSGPNAVANAVSKRVPYDGVTSFTPISAITTNPSVLTISTKVPARDFKEFQQYALSQQKGVTMGIAGYGSYTHLVAALINDKGGLKATIVPYKGTGPAATDLMGQQLDAMVDQITTAAPLVRDGRVKAVAQTGEQRSPLLPDVPTMAEQGHPELTSIIYTGLFGPAGMPAAVTTKLAQAMDQVRRNDAVRQRFQEIGADVSTLSAEQFPDYVRADAQRWARAAQQAHVSVDE
ncbi:tripartite tricarboxylate transporter substrate binding protein [Bordetella sp. LUAb4]|uniref:Bug family tripartite tricarboxylate transporter substrate binding protein n=1 Tax=Bordetella sp. LUAb4 TaxID=2843195 RepID=UPI001E5D0317|nr:tripartite tricarboxylate transporter substrate binding protein [Bordetella sp. LUAb4]